MPFILGHVNAGRILRGVTCLLAAAAVLGAGPAAAATKCRSSDMRYPFQMGGPKDFGVFALRITNGTCTTARRIARMWMKDFEDAIDAGRVRLPKHEGGFTFKTLRATEAQTYRERGTKGSTTITFKYRVPNG